MKNCPPQLLAFFETHDAFNRADLILIELKNGQCITATTSQIPIEFSYGYTYAGSPVSLVPSPPTWYYPTKFGAWERGKVKSEVSFAPKSNTMPLKLIAKDDVLFPVGATTNPLNMTMTQVVSSGLFEAAKVSVFTVYWALDETPAQGVKRGYLITFIGQIANSKQAGRSEIKFDVVDMLYLLNYNTPPNIIQSGCRHSLFDHGCTLNQVSFELLNSVAAASNSVYLNLGTDVTTAAFWNAYMTFSQGKLQFTSGLNNGLWYYIKQQVSDTEIQLGRPLLFPPTTGDTFLMYPGCAKTLVACDFQFNNLIHIGAQPYVPNPEYGI